MAHLEYKVVPAPEKARKVRGLKGAALFAHAMEELMNDLAADGWTYVRADTLPQEERSGLTSKTTTYRNLLVFQRAADAENTAEAEVETGDAPMLTAAIAAHAVEPSGGNAADEPANDTRTEPPLLRALRADPDDTASNAGDTGLSANGDPVPAAPTSGEDSPRPLFPNRQSERVDL